MASNSTEQAVPSQDDEEFCTIEASVVTGFEESARGEAKEKFGTDVKAARGQITWRVPLNKVNEVLKMGSVDNLKVVVHRIPYFQFTDQHDSLARLQKMVKDVDWESGLKVWQRIYNFPHVIASRPDKEVSADDLVDVVIATLQPLPTDKSVKKKKKKAWGKKKNKKKDGADNNKENVVACESGVNIEENVSTENVEGNIPELSTIVDNCPKSPVNERGDANVQKEMGLEEVDDNTQRLEVKVEGQTLPDPSSSVTTRSSFDSNGSPVKEPSTENSVSMASRKFRESEFASDVIKRLNSPSGSSPKEDTGYSPKEDADYPKDCVTPPPTPNRIIENPFSNLQDRLHAELLPFLDNSVPGSHGSNNVSSVPSSHGSNNQDAQQDGVAESGSSVDPPFSSTDNKIQVDSNIATTCSVSSNVSEVPLLTILPISANTDRNDGPKSETSVVQSRDVTQQTAENVLDERSSSGDGITRVKKERDPTKPTFRVTCNRAGDSHPFDSSSAAASFGSAVITYLNWQVDLKNFDIEVILNIDNDEVTVSLALTKMSLHYRNLVAFGPTTLRATICYNMLRLCHIKNGDFICDPMCGTSAIPIEGALNWVNCYHFGGDAHEKAIQKTVLNIAAIQNQMQTSNRSTLKLDALQWNVQHLPLRDKCVDVFVSDLPFGHRIGSRSENPALYSHLLSEMARTARAGARACLLTEDKASFIKAVQALGRYWQRRLVLNVNIGGLTGFVFLLTRTTSSVVQSWTSLRDGENPLASEGNSEETILNDASNATLSHVQDTEARNQTE